MSWRFKIITAPNTASLCYSSWPQLCVPNDRWRTVECKPHSVLLKTPAEYGLKRFHWKFCSDQKQFETNKTNHAEASYLDLWILTSCQPQRGTVEQITYSVFFYTSHPPPPHTHTHNQEPASGLCSQHKSPANMAKQATAQSLRTYVNIYITLILNWHSRTSSQHVQHKIKNLSKKSKSLSWCTLATIFCLSPPSTINLSALFIICKLQTWEPASAACDDEQSGLF